MKKKISKICGLLLCIGCMLFSTLHVWAEETEREEETSLSLECKNGKESYALYGVADFSETGEFVIREPFSKYPIVIQGLDSEGWRALAETLAGYVERDEIEPLDKKETDDKGHLTWNNLQKGLYLVLGEQIKKEQYLYTPMPLLVTVPNRTENGEWNYQPLIHPKYNKEDLSEEQEIDRNVIKIWKDQQNKKMRPEKISVQLLKDGKVYDTVELSKKNNWQYTWKKLSAQSKWTVVEQNVPKNYTVTSTQENNNFIVTNTYVTFKDEGNKGENVHQKLPQTGQLWWPVPILVIVGALLFTVGFRKYRK